MRLRSIFARSVPGLVVAVTLSACGGPVGSCALPATDAGFGVCEDFLGSDYNSSAAQNTCSEASGTYSSSACSTTGALGTCQVGAGAANEYQYTYVSSGSSPTTTDLESACGVAGGTFTAG